MFAKIVDDLLIYKKALKLAFISIRRVKQFPHHWNIPEGNQLMRSSSSVPSNIAEGFSHRFYTKQFIRYLNIALGSSDECQNHIKKLILDEHISTEEGELWAKEYKGLSINILNFINYLEIREKKKRRASTPLPGPQWAHHMAHH